MSNFNFFYSLAIIIISTSLFYLLFVAVQFIQMDKKQQKSSSARSSQTPSQFLRHALMAFVGLILGIQMLQYTQDKTNSVNSTLTRDATIARALDVHSAASTNAASSNFATKATPGQTRIGSRPMSRPSRGNLSGTPEQSPVSTSKTIDVEVPGNKKVDTSLANDR